MLFYPESAAENIGQLVLGLGALIVILTVIVSIALWAGNKGTEISNLIKSLDEQKKSFEKALADHKIAIEKRVEDIDRRSSTGISELRDQVGQLDRWAIVTTNIINNKREQLGDGVPQLRISDPSSFHKTRVKQHKKFDP